MARLVGSVRYNFSGIGKIIILLTVPHRARLLALLCWSTDYPSHHYIPRQIRHARNEAANGLASKPCRNGSLPVFLAGDLGSFSPTLIPI